MTTRKLPKKRVHLSPHFKFLITLMALGLSLPVAALSSVGRNSDKSQGTTLNFAQASYYQSSSTDQQNSPGTQTNNLNPAICSDEDDLFTFEESEGNLKFAHKINHSEAVTPIELLPSLFSEASKFDRPHIYLITTCLRI